MIPQPLVLIPVHLDEADDHATQTVIDAQREVGIRTAVSYLIVGNRGRAYYELVRSVRRQWRLANGGSYPVEPAALPTIGGAR